MELIKFKKVKMRAVDFIFAVSLLTLGCQGVRSVNSDSTELYKGGTYTIDSLRSKDNFSSTITCEFFHFDDKKKAIGGLNINGVIFLPDHSGKSTFSVLPGKYTIESGFPGKKWTVINDIKIIRGDSLRIKIYLEDDDRPLH